MRQALIALLAVTMMGAYAAYGDVVIETDNGGDHRAGTSNLNFKKHVQIRRVHRIVQVSRYRGGFVLLEFHGRFKAFEYS